MNKKKEKERDRIGIERKTMKTLRKNGKRERNEQKIFFHTYNVESSYLAKLDFYYQH